MVENEILQLLTDAGVLQEGHFRLSSGLHSGRYMQCAKLFERADLAESICRVLAQRLRDVQVDTVVSPALGGVLFGYELSRHLGVRNIFAERQEGTMTLRRGFVLKPGEKVLVAEDVVTTGGSVREVLEVCRAHQAEPVGIAAVVDRSGGEVDFGLPFWSLVTVKFEVYDPQDCPLCRAGEPIVKPGSRTHFPG